MTLHIDHLSKSFPHPGSRLWGVKGSVRALSDINLHLTKGESLGIAGESGSGKTTLAKILAGHLNADQGNATWAEKNLLDLKPRERARLVQMVFQDPFSSLNPKLLLGTQIEEALSPPRTNARARAGQLMSDVGLPADFLKRYPHQLSGGQRQRFAIARALAAAPELLIADEPVSSLDILVQAQIIRLLNELKQKQHFTLIVISHDLAVIANLCERIIVMKDGVLCEEGTVTAVLSHPQHAYTQRLLDATPVV